MNQLSNQTSIRIAYLPLLLTILFSGCIDSAPKSPVANNADQSIEDDTAIQNPYTEQATEGSATETKPDELPTLAEATKLQEERRDEVVEQKPPPEVHTIDIPKTWKRFGDKHEIWIDFESRQVITGGNICMQAGQLEVFACPRHTKEHEAIVSVNALASEVHAGLLAIKSEPGEPVKWADEYQKATGPVIKIDVMWKTDDDQVVTRPAQDFVRNTKTGQTMSEDWVFGGSQEFHDKESGHTFYYGDSGEMVCLSNFSTATMDVPLQSSDANEGLLFEANPNNVPQVGTKVYLIFKPGPNLKKTDDKQEK